MPLAYPSGTIEEHLACRAAARSRSTSATSAPCGSRARARSTTLQAAAHQRPGQDRPRPGAVHPPARRRRRLGARRHHRVVASTTRRFDVMPNASNTERVRAAIGGDDVTGGAGHHRRAGPRGAARGWRRSRPRPRRSAGSASRPFDVAGHALHRRRHRLHGRGRGRDLGARGGRASTSGGRSSPRAWRRRGWAPGTPSGWRPPCRCTATSSGPASRRCRPGWAGSCRGPSRRSAARTHSRPSGSEACTGCCGASAPRGGDRRGRSARCASPAPRRGRPPAGTSRPSSATASRSPSCRPTVEEGTAVEVDLRGSALAGSVVTTPFVRKA